MLSPQKFNRDKAIEVLVYVAQRCPNKYHALKAVFFADKKHLERYGRLIFGDTYRAMEYGPVPSAAYDLVKAAPTQADNSSDDPLARAIRRKGRFGLVALRDPDLEMLSLSDVECLDEAVAECSPQLGFGFNELRDMAHKEPAFVAVGGKGWIPFETLVRNLPDGDEIWRQLADC